MIIVTGSQGFIGKKFLQKLREDVVLVDKDDSLQFKKNFNRWKDVDLILHQGAISDTTCTDINAIFHFNVEFTEWIFQQSIKYQIPIKYASSASVYGNTSELINPLNYYAISKVISDYWVQDHIDEFKLVQGFRYFNVYGEGEDHKNDQASPVHKFSKQIKETNKLELFEGSDKFMRDFVCVDDVVDIVLNNDKSSGIYDLGTSNPVSFQHVAECVIKKFGGEINFVPFPDHLKNKYQHYTCAKNEWGSYQFTKVADYLK